MNGSTSRPSDAAACSSVDSSALQRLEEDGWIAGEWGLSENNRKARFYTITKAGRRQLAKEEDHWKAISVAVSRVLEGA